MKVVSIHEIIVEEWKKTYEYEFCTFMSRVYEIFIYTLLSNEFLVL
jgi:hypothetical protein